MQKGPRYRQLGAQINFLFMTMSKFVVRPRGHGGDALRISMFMEERFSIRCVPVPLQECNLLWTSIL